MKTIKGWIPTTFLTIALALSATTANAGIIYGVSDNEPTKPCKVEQTDDVDVNSGIIYGITGIIYGLTGIIYGATGEPQEDCGIIYG